MLFFVYSIFGPVFFWACQLVDSQREPVQPCAPVNICCSPATADYFFANFIFCQESSPFLNCKSTFAPRLPVPVWSVPKTRYLMSLEQGLADESNYRFRWLLLKTFLRIYMPTREQRICKSCNTLVSFLPKVNRPSRLNFYIARWQ